MKVFLVLSVAYAVIGAIGAAYCLYESHPQIKEYYYITDRSGYTTYTECSKGQYNQKDLEPWEWAEYFVNKNNCEKARARDYKREE